VEVGFDPLLNVLLPFLGKLITTAPKLNFPLELCFPHIHHFKLVFSTQGIGHHVFLPRLVPNVHIEQGQCVLPSHLFWWQFWLGGKVLQGHIVGPHHHILGAYVMAPSLETMYHGPHFLFMGWPPSLCFTQFLAFKNHRPSILHWDSSYGKVGRIGMDLKILVKIGHFQMGTSIKMPFKVSKVSLHASSHS